MSAFFRNLTLGLALLTGAQVAHSFSLLGPKEAYHVEALGYIGDFSFAPKNLGDEYRWNTPVVYYAIDAEFIDYFGSNGIAAIDAAASILNNLTNVSSFSPGLTDFGLESMGQNYTASALNLFDVKSCAMEVLVERLGLADPEEFAWTLRVRALPPGAQCPNYYYEVIQRNFDPFTLSPTAFINGNLFTYRIFEFCPTPSQAIAAEVLLNPPGQLQSAVASSKISVANPLYYGFFHTALTRDDAGGLRYMMATNNLNWERTPDNAFVVVTNQTPTLVFPTNLQVFAEQAVTNNAAALQALYPGLVVTSTSNYFVNEVTTNAFAYFTNRPFAPYGTTELVLGTNFTTNVATRFVHTFDNIITNAFYPFCFQSLLTTNIGPGTFAPPGSGISQTNVTIRTWLDTNCVSGSIIILPTNVCGYHILATQLTQVIFTTNFLSNTFVTNIVTATNAATTNVLSDYFEFSLSELDVWTNHILVAWPVNCPDDLTTLLEGIEKVNFIRRDYDSLLGQFFEPIVVTNFLTEITNNTRILRPVVRTVAQPDVTFTADDIATGPGDWPIINPTISRQVPIYDTPTNSNISGPGTIRPTVEFTFNKVGQFLLNIGPAFITEASVVDRDFVWGSFDGSTNAPIVYPVGTDLLTLENLVVLQVTQPTTVTNGALALPDAANFQPYSFQLEALGGQPPLSWQLSPSVFPNGLPPGLALSATGLLSGTLGVAGTYTFALRLSEAGQRYVDRPFTLIVYP